MKSFFKRLRLAFNTNETQITAVVFFTAITTYAILTSPNPNRPLWVEIAGVLFWPVLAFSFNFFDPIRTYED